MCGERGVCIQGLLCLPGRGRGSLLTTRGVFSSVPGEGSCQRLLSCSHRGKTASDSPLDHKK